MQSVRLLSQFRAVFVWSILAIVVIVATMFLIARSTPETEPKTVALPAPCSTVSFEQSEFITCTVDPVQYRISLHLRDDQGKPWYDLQRFAGQMHPVMSTNAGMYHEDLTPVGLYVENGKQITPLQIGTGDGNFFMKPNGVFGLSPEGLPFVLTTEAYAASEIPISYASQSGPMLVIDGAIHSRFEPDGASRYTRNGVGIDGHGRAVFAISREKVSFGKLARLFRDALHSKNALYSDGVVSALSGNDSIIEGGGYPAGPIMAVFEKQHSPSR
jgi:uncharacterized protein YigE (DUF2233 family)